MLHTLMNSLPKIRLDNETPSQPGNAGASRDEIFTITGLQKGTVHATFIQGRHREPESEAIKKIEYTFEVS